MSSCGVALVSRSIPFCVSVRAQLRFIGKKRKRRITLRTETQEQCHELRRRVCVRAREREKWITSALLGGDHIRVCLRFFFRLSLVLFLPIFSTHPMLSSFSLSHWSRIGFCFWYIPRHDEEKKTQKQYSVLCGCVWCQTHTCAKRRAHLNVNFVNARVCAGIVGLKYGL